MKKEIQNNNYRKYLYKQIIFILCTYVPLTISQWTVYERSWNIVTWGRFLSPQADVLDNGRENQICQKPLREKHVGQEENIWKETQHYLSTARNRHVFFGITVVWWRVNFSRLWKNFHDQSEQRADKLIRFSLNGYFIITCLILLIFSRLIFSKDLWNCLGKYLCQLYISRWSNFCFLFWYLYHWNRKSVSMA